MREMLRLVATAGVLLALPALAAPPPSGAATATSSASGHEPFSLRASNIVPADTKSEIAPALPAPPGGDFATVPMLLHDARVALVNKQTGAAQEALERAETRLLDRSVPLGSTDQPAPVPRWRRLPTPASRWAIMT